MIQSLWGEFAFRRGAAKKASILALKVGLLFADPAEVIGGEQWQSSWHSFFYSEKTGEWQECAVCKTWGGAVS